MHALSTILKFGLVFVALTMIAVTVVYFYFAHTLPEISSLKQYQPPLVSRIYDEKGELLAEYADEHRILTPLEEIPLRLRNAFLAAEDVHFYQHPGINPPRILSALIANLKAGHTVQGGSTITQQVAKNLLLSPERTYSRKIREILLAYEMEKNLSKDEILYLYLNHIYLGRGAYGVASAAWRYFRKTLKELSLAECALLAGLPKAPSRYAPHIHPELALARRNAVLNAMAENGLAPRTAVEKAKQEPIVIAPLFKPKIKNAYEDRVLAKIAELFGPQTIRRQGLSIIIPYRQEDQNAAIRALRQGVIALEERQPYAGPIAHYPKEQWDAVLQDLKAKYPSSSPPKEDTLVEGLVLPTKVSGKLRVSDGTQEWILSAPRWRWAQAAYETRPPTWVAGDLILLRGNGQGGVRITQRTDVESALYAVDLEKGTVLAWVGGFDFHKGGFDHVLKAERQPGSAFKPFLYALAMDLGYTPASIFIDSPLVFQSRETASFWRPENYKNRFAGPVTLRNALEHSRNLVSIKLLEDIGVPRFLEFLKRFPFEREFPPQLALALGSSEVTLKELTEAYLVLASLGKRWQPVMVQQVQDRNGKTLYRSVAGTRCQVCHADAVLDAGMGMHPAEQVLDPVSAFLTVNLMRGVVERGTGRRARALGRPAAGKTGTTNNQVDAWFLGFTPQVLTGVWVGRENAKPLGRLETGAHAALPIWLSAMKTFHQDRPIVDFDVPPGIEWVVIDPKTGQIATKDTSSPFLEAFRIGTAPQPPEPIP